ncbi:MAG: tRNA (5-methylaminomethyl-2-thiouridine)(34)-methyltransferase MnmD [Prochloraceae cyanobacterium]
MAKFLKNMSDRSNFSPKLTADGSFTFFSNEFNEDFHSHFGAKQEAIAKFVEPCQIAQKAAKSDRLCLLDICYGLGYNTAAALAVIWQTNPKCFVEWIGLEINPQISLQAIDRQLLNEYPSPIPKLLKQLTTTDRLETSQFLGTLLVGDARIKIQKVLDRNFIADAIFLDPFSPPKCPQLWTVEFLNLVAKCLKPTGIIATYSCAASVRKALSLSGLKLSSSFGLGRPAPGTVASYLDLTPLSPRELEHLSTRAAIPYRDPTLQDCAASIIERRQTEQQSSNLEPTKRWKKRWLTNN